MKRTLSSLPHKMRLTYERIYSTTIVRASRARDCKRSLANKAAHRKTLTAKQRDEIIDYWTPFVDVKPHLPWFEFYHTACNDESQLKHYIPDPIHFTQIDMFFTSPRHSEAIDDKNMYDLYFHDVNTPATLVRKINGELLDKSYQPIDINRAIDLCAQAGHVLGKAARMSFGGHGVKFFDLATGTTNGVRQYLEQADDIIIQEVIGQHETLSRINSTSINTIRIMTLMLDGKVHILSAVLRMGQQGSRVDNASSGGVVCGIDDDGRLKEYAFDHNGNRYDGHPQSGPLKDIRIEGYDKCRELVTTLAGRMCGTSRLVSWDLAIDPSGQPALIEVNLTNGELDFHQLCNGPIFGELTGEVLSSVFTHSATNQ